MKKNSHAPALFLFLVGNLGYSFGCNFFSYENAREECQYYFECLDGVQQLDWSPQIASHLELGYARLLVRVGPDASHWSRSINRSGYMLQQECELPRATLAANFPQVSACAADYRPGLNAQWATHVELRTVMEEQREDCDNYLSCHYAVDTSTASLAAAEYASDSVCWASDDHARTCGRSCRLAEQILVDEFGPCGPPEPEMQWVENEEVCDEPAAAPDNYSTGGILEDDCDACCSALGGMENNGFGFSLAEFTGCRCAFRSR